MTLALHGTNVSKGIAIGTAHILESGELEIPQKTIPAYLVQAEISRYQFALQVASQQLRVIQDHIPKHTPKDIASFIDTHLLMLADPMIMEGPIKIIKQKLCNAEHALKTQCDQIVAVFQEMDDAYLRTRKDDVEHVVNRIQRILLNQPSEKASIIDRLRGQIIITDDLSPADTILMQHHDVVAIISELGGPTSHTAILARSLNIPAIVGAKHVCQYIKDGEKIIIDSLANVIIVDPDDKILEHYYEFQKLLQRKKASLNDIKLKPSTTVDRKKIVLHANIELPDDLTNVKKVAASGIGLFRTEFLFLNRTQLPDENEQYQAYRRVIKSLKGLPVTIRTLDLGADKSFTSKANPDLPMKSSALGLRAIRLCLKDPSLFKPQLCAILRASAHGPVKLMLPMISNLLECQQVRTLVEQCKLELKKRRLKFDNKLPIGCMIETPAAALMAETLAENTDFLSIGTNDLIQYTLAIDRIDNEVNYLYDPLHPAVLRLIHKTIKAGIKSGIPVSLCGEMAGERIYTRLLLGMGLTEFSMHPSTLLEVKEMIRLTNTKKLTTLTNKILKCSTSNEVAVHLEKLNSL